MFPTWPWQSRKHLLAGKIQSFPCSSCNFDLLQCLQFCHVCPAIGILKDLSQCFQFVKCQTDFNAHVMSRISGAMYLLVPTRGFWGIFVSPVAWWMKLINKLLKTLLSKARQLLTFPNHLKLTWVCVTARPKSAMTQVPSPRTSTFFDLMSRCAMAGLPWKVFWWCGLIQYLVRWCSMVYEMVCFSKEYSLSWSGKLRHGLWRYFSES